MTDKQSGNGEAAILPHDAKSLTASCINQWRRHWKKEDGGGGMYGPSRLETIDAICDAAIIAQGMLVSSREDYERTMAKHLRQMANQIDPDTSA